jgi:hypothetical protein
VDSLDSPFHLSFVMTICYIFHLIKDLKIVETKTKYILILLATGTFIFLFNLGGRDLWEPDETRYAVIAREMVQNGKL